MIEESVYNKINKLIGSMLSAGTNISEAFLQVLIAVNKEHKEKHKYDVIPEGALKKMVKAVKGGDKLMTLNVADEDAMQFAKILKDAGVTFTIPDMTTDDTKLVLFLESETEKVKDAIKVLYAEKGLLSEMDMSTLLTDAKDQQLSFLTNVSNVELEILRYQSRSNPFPYSVIENEQGESCVVFKTADIDKMHKAINTIASDLTGEQGPLIREQIEIKLKGRQEVNIALEEAERESYIVDKKNPKNFIAVTATDYTYYKNNKGLESIPRTQGVPSAVYTRLDSLTEPVVLTKDEFFLSEAEKRALLQSKTAVYPSIEEELSKNKTGELTAEARAYAEKFGIYAVDERDTSLETVLSKIEQMQSESNRNPEDRSKDDIQYR